jgi:hypothetical protein
MEIDFFGPPKKPWEVLDRSYSRNKVVLVIEDILESKSTYNHIFQDMLDIFKYKFEIEEERKRIIHYKFHKEDKEIREIELRHLMCNLIFWKSLIDIDKVELLDESFLFDFSNFNADTLIDYIDNVLLPINDSDFRSQNAMVDDIYYAIVSISHAFCLLMGMGMSLYSIIDLEKRIPEVHNIMYDNLDDSLSPKEIETELAQRTDKLIDYIVKDDQYNDLKPLFASKSGLKKGQFKEVMVKIGLKANIDGATIPILINNNFLVNGLDKPSYVYINITSGRKALINVKSGMGY